MESGKKDNPFDALNQNIKKEDSKALFKKEDKPEKETSELSNLVPNGMWLDMITDTLEEIESNKSLVDDMIPQFMDMVMNSGDATSATKEALVNLIKLRCEIPDKKTKVADLLTRIKLKESSTFPAYMAKHSNNGQGNTLSPEDKKAMISKLDSVIKEQKVGKQCQ